ncbi:MAG: hypothetical protein HGA69_00785 [Desulfobulbaceae bacterium]|nr:hypothetical protein [Desulfobulbaceae bacterium]
MISQITKTATGLPAYFAYAAGFAVGNYVGMKIEDALAIGKVVVRMILSTGGEQVAHALHEKCRKIKRNPPVFNWEKPEGLVIGYED